MSGSAASPDVVAVVCSVCQTRFHARTVHVGKRVRCPDCQSPCLVPAPPPAPVKRTLPSGDEYRLADDHESPTAKQPSLTRVTCSVCSTLMYAQPEHAGKRIRCPDCGGLTVVPAAKLNSAAAFVVPDTSDVKLDAAPPASIDETRKEVADRLMAAATEHVAAQQREQPTPPRFPLRDGIYLFPCQWQIIPVWLLLALGIIAECLLIDEINALMDGGGITMVLAAFIVPIIAGVTAVLLGFATPQYLHIIEFTSEGFDKSPYWPAVDFETRLRAVFLWVNAVAMASAPGMLLVLPFRRFGLPSWLGLLSTVVLLPPIVLSMLERDSIFVPFSRGVFRKVTDHRLSWLMVTLHFAVIGGTVILVYWLVSRTFIEGRYATTAWQHLPRGVLIVMLSFASILACRLIGRLAWIISKHGHEDVDDDEDADEVIDSPSSNIPDHVAWN